MLYGLYLIGYLYNVSSFASVPAIKQEPNPPLNSTFSLHLNSHTVVKCPYIAGHFGSSQYWISQSPLYAHFTPLKSNELTVGPCCAMQLGYPLRSYFALEINAIGFKPASRSENRALNIKHRGNATLYVGSIGLVGKITIPSPIFLKVV